MRKNAWHFEDEKITVRAPGEDFLSFLSVITDDGVEYTPFEVNILLSSGLSTDHIDVQAHIVKKVFDGTIKKVARYTPQELHDRAMEQI